jgi:F0F1-type ATP synthase delta subunit
MATIYELYKKLFGKEERCSVRLDRSVGGGIIVKIEKERESRVVDQSLHYGGGGICS